jgi:hypothetical protein
MQRLPAEQSKYNSVKHIIRLLASLLGVVIIAIGLVFTIKVFLLIFNALNSPGNLQELLLQWQAALNFENFNMEFDERVIPFASILTIFVVGIGLIILGWLSLSMMRTGSKIISITSDDREAIKHVLSYVFGDRDAED